MSFSQHVKALTDNQLVEAIAEIRASQSTGILAPDGVTRRLAETFEVCGLADGYVSLRVAEQEILMEVALRWVSAVSSLV